jgi:hypothetical protein
VLGVVPDELSKQVADLERVRERLGHGPRPREASLATALEDAELL